MQSRRWYIFLLAAGLLFTNYWLLLDNCYAQQESVTITTYYPSPYGSYNELQSNKLAVGDTNGDNQLTSADLPSANGQLYVARSVIFKPHTNFAAIQTLTNPRIGELVYAAAEDKWYYYNGAWVPQAGEEGIQFVGVGWYSDSGGGHLSGCQGIVTRKNSSGQDYMYSSMGQCACLAPAVLFTVTSWYYLTTWYSSMACVK